MQTITHDKRVCPDCDGTGEITERGHSVNPRSGVSARDPQCDETWPCEVCHGDGQVDEDYNEGYD